jgi:hypothetical protein
MISSIPDKNKISPECKLALATRIQPLSQWILGGLLGREQLSRCVEQAALLHLEPSL